MKTYNCIIIDDEELSRDLLENFIARVPSLSLKGRFTQPLEAISTIKDGAIDLIFLDIQMPEITGVEFLKSFSIESQVILTTAYDSYALESYELSIVDYLLKPFSFNRYLKAVNKALAILDLKNKSQLSHGKTAHEDFLLIKADHKTHRLKLSDILYIQSMKEYIMYYTDEEKIMTLGSLKSLEDRLPTSDFIRIHKSYIVAKKQVKSLEGNKLHLDSVSLPIGGSYRQSVKSVLFK